MTGIGSVDIAASGPILEIRLGSDAGPIGLGAVGTAPEGLDAAREIAACLVGRDAYDRRAIRAALADRASPDLIGAVETALLDLQAHERGLSLAQIFGGVQNAEIALGSVVSGLPTVRTLPTIEALAQALRNREVDLWIADPIVLGGPSVFLQGLALARTFLIDIAIDARRHGPIGEALALQLAAASTHIKAGVLVASGKIGKRRIGSGLGLGLTSPP